MELRVKGRWEIVTVMGLDERRPVIESVEGEDAVEILKAALDFLGTPSRDSPR